MEAFEFRRSAASMTMGDILIRCILLRARYFCVARLGCIDNEQVKRNVMRSTYVFLIGRSQIDQIVGSEFSIFKCFQQAS